MEENYTNIKERILYYAKFKGISIETFLASIDMTYGSFKGKAKLGSINSDALVKIYTKYPDLNYEWLLTGEGSITKSYTHNDLGEQTKVYKLRTDRYHDKQLVPLYGLEATASLVSLFQNQGDEKPIDYISIPNLPKCDGALPITGDSMYPLLKSGDIIMFKEIENHIDNIIFGEMYLISFDLSGEEFVTVKWLHQSSKGDNYITLVSENKHHQPKDIPLKKVRAMALIKASIRINSMR